MREGIDILHGMRPDVAGLVLDLERSDALVEAGEEVYPWLGGEAVAGPVGSEAAAVVPAAVAEKVMAVPKPVEEAVVVAAAAEIWQAGEPSGVVVVQGGLPLSAEGDQLVRRMLAAVGCGEMPCAWVGVTDGAGRKGMSAQLGAAVAGFEAKRVLVLGGPMLQVWSGKPTGVEAWRVGVEVLPGMAEGVPVGVTYAPDMLLAKPLFKRLAWKHLQAWEQHFGGQA